MSLLLFGVTRVNGIYCTLSRLVELSQVRSRVHISNRKRMESLNEAVLFRDDAKLQAEKLCEELVRKCAADLSRGQYFTYVKPLWFPWNSHCA